MNPPLDRFCAVCGASINYRRKSAFTCSDSCRKTRSRHIRKKRNRAPGFYDRIPAAEYHAGLSDPRPLSSTLAKNLLRLLPEEAEYSLTHNESTPAYAFGSAVHELLLEGRLRTVVEIEADSFRGGAAREARDAAIASGKSPMLTHELDDVVTLVKAVKKNPHVRSLLVGGRAEVSALAWLNNCPVQARFDYLNRDGGALGDPGWIVDVKTVAGSASPTEFNRSAAKYGYHIQAALYQRVAAKLLGHDLPFYWLVISKNPPYASSIIRASDVDLYTGSERVDEALELWRGVLNDGWDYDTEIHESALPAWIRYERAAADSTPNGLPEPADVTNTLNILEGLML